MAKRRVRQNLTETKTARLARASKSSPVEKDTRTTMAAAAPAATVTPTPRFAKCSILIPEGDGPPEWIELLPAGKFSANDGRGPWTVGDAAKVLAATRAFRAEQP